MENELSQLSSNIAAELTPGSSGPVGIDLVPLNAFAGLTPQSPAVAENFTAEEVAYAAGRADPAASLAGAWAAKEAFLKALGCGLTGGVIRPHEVQLRHDAVGAPRLSYDRAVARRAGVEAGAVQVSVTHAGGLAAAVVFLPPGTRRIQRPLPMPKTGGIKNYEKSRAEIVELLAGSSAAEAPPAPIFTGDGEAHAALLSLADDPELAPLFALARRCGIELRVVSVHPEAFENLDGAEESNDFRKLAPYAQLHFLALTLDARTYAELQTDAPLSEGARGVVLVNRGLLEGPPELAEARELLLRSELLHEAVHFESPGFSAQSDLQEEWVQEAAGIARQVATLVHAGPEARALAEALITDTLEGNPVKGSFDLELGDGTTRRIASKTFMVLEMELEELQRCFGSLTPDGMSPALFRLVDRIVGDEQLFQPEQLSFTDAGLTELLRYITRQDKDFRREVKREVGTQSQELVPPADGPALVRQALQRVDELLAGRVEPTFPEPALESMPVAGDEAEPAAAAPATVADPFEAERAERARRLPPAPSRATRARCSLLVQAEQLPGVALDGACDVVLDLRRARVSSEELARVRERSLAAARDHAARGGRLSLRLARDPDQALEELGRFLPELTTSVVDVVIDAEHPEDVWRVDDELTEMERIVGLDPGSVGIQLTLYTAGAVADVKRLALATPRVSAVELGATLPAQLGWVFQPRPGEDRGEAVLRRVSEAERALEPARERSSLLLRAAGVPLLRGPVTLAPNGALAAVVHRLLESYDGVRLAGLEQAAALPALPPAELLQRLQSLETTVFTGENSDPDAPFRLEEDLRVLETAVDRGALGGGSLERYWRARWTMLYDPDVPASIPVPEVTLPEALLAAARRHPERRFLYRAEGTAADGSRRALSAEVPFEDILGPAAYRIARVLRDLGVERGDRVALSTSNTLAHIATFQAVGLLGAVLVPLDPTKGHLADRFFNDAEVKLLVFDASVQNDDTELHHTRLLSWARDQGLEEDPAFWEELVRSRRKLGGGSAETLASLVNLLPAELRQPFTRLFQRKLDAPTKFAETLPKVPSLRSVVITRVEDLVPGAPRAEGLAGSAAELARALGPRVRVELLDRLLEGVSDEPLQPAASPADHLAWPYTGGTTTGVSKAVGHTHRSLLALGLQRGLTMVPDSDRHDHVVATTLPFTHTYGFATGVLTPVLTGADALVVPNTGPRYLPMIAESMVDDRASVLFSSRSALATLARLIPETAELSSLVRIASSGDTLTAAVTELWRQRFGITPCSGYGSTETPSSLMNPTRTNRAGTEGIPVPNVEARVVDPESGEVLPPGRPGLLQLRGPHLATGYIGRPDADAKSLRADGWWQKDDIFKMDRDGYFIFCGRADDMFTVNELNVYPDAVEQALLTLPGVAEAGVIGVFDEALGTNRVKALVVPEPGATISPEQVMEGARPLLEAHEAPTLVEIVDSLARSNFGKLSRAALRKEDARQAVAEPEAPAAQPAPAAPSELVPGDVLLVFPTGGSHWPGMGADLEISDHYRLFVDRAEQALARVGVPRGALRRLMAGEGQAERVQREQGWDWSGDFPLSVAAQTVLGVALANAFVLTHGTPGALVGESMGEVAAYCAAGALELEDAVVLAYRWAQALQASSDALGLRMAVVENLDRRTLDGLGPDLDANVVIAEAPTLHVVALPRDNLAALESAVGQAGGRVLVSNNPCAAHEPRLRQQTAVWDSYRQLLDGLELQPAILPLLSALEPGRRLRSPRELRDNLEHTVFQRVQWAGTVTSAVENGLTTLVQLGTTSSAYALDKLQADDPALDGAAISSVGTLAGVDLLDAAPGRCWTGMPVPIGDEGIRALARASGDRNLYHLDRDYARRTRYGEVILHGVGTEGLLLAEAARRFPSLEITAARVPSFKQPVKVGDTVRPVVEVQGVTGSELTLRLVALNGWGDIICEGSARLCPRIAGQTPHGISVDLARYGERVEPFEERPPADFHESQSQTFRFDLDQERIGATRKLFPGGDGAFSAALGIELISFASASFAPGYVLTGTRLLDVRRGLAELKQGLTAAGLDDDTFRDAAAGAEDTDGLLAALPLRGKAGRAVKRGLTSTARETLDLLLSSQRTRELLLSSWASAERPVAAGPLDVTTVVEKLEGSAPDRSVEIGMEVVDRSGRLLYLGGVSKTESPPAEEGTGIDEEQRLAETLVQQKIINVFPVTRPRDAENSAADPAVNAALVDLEDAVSPTMRREARPRAVEMFGRVRRDSPRSKKSLVTALQTARARLKGGDLGKALLDPAAHDFESLMGQLEFRKKGGDDFRKAMKKPQQRLLQTYLQSACTRRALLDAVGHLDFAGKVLKLRPNNVRTDAAAADYYEVVRHIGNRVDALTIPKTRFPAEIVNIDRVLTAIEEQRGWPLGRIKLELLIEHPLAVQFVDKIAAASPRIISLIYGHVDYTAATRGWDQNFQFEYQRHAKVRTVEAAHANGQIAIDAITPAISAEAARIDAERAVAMGFDGKWSIHLDHIVGIRQVQFPPPRLQLKPHPGGAGLPGGAFSLDELARMARDGMPLDGTPLPPPRGRLRDLRAMLRVAADSVDRVPHGQASQVQVDLRGVDPDDGMARRLRDLGQAGAVVLTPDAPEQRLRLVGGIAATLVLEASEGGAPLTPEAVARAAEIFPGRILVSLTRADELQRAYDIASATDRVAGIINSVSRADDWETSGAVVNAAWALGIDPLQGVDAEEGWEERAFRAAHMGITGQLTGDQAATEGLRGAYTPPTDLVQEAAAIIERYYRAERVEHLGAIPYEFTYLQDGPTRGLVDAATAKIFNAVVNRAAELDLLDDEQSLIQRSYVQRWHWNDSGEEVDFTRWEWVPGEGGAIRLRSDPEQRARVGDGPGELSRSVES